MILLQSFVFELQDIVFAPMKLIYVDVDVQSSNLLAQLVALEYVIRSKLDFFFSDVDSIKDSLFQINSKEISLQLSNE